MSSRSQPIPPHPLTLSAYIMYNLTPRYAFADPIINIVSALLSSCLVTQQKKMALEQCVLGVTCCLLYSAISYSFPPPKRMKAWRKKQRHAILMRRPLVLVWVGANTNRWESEPGACVCNTIVLYVYTGQIEIRLSVCGRWWRPCALLWIEGAIFFGHIHLGNNNADRSARSTNPLSHSMIIRMVSVYW